MEFAVDYAQSTAWVDAAKTGKPDRPLILLQSICGAEWRSGATHNGRTYAMVTNNNW